MADGARCRGTLAGPAGSVIRPTRHLAVGNPRASRAVGVRAVIASVALVMVAGAAACDRRPPGDAPAPDEWIVLFDGTSVEHWRGYQRDDFPTDGWTIDGDALKPTTDGTVIDIITRRQFRNYELELEWRVAPRGNSGIFVHVAEGPPHVWHTGPEFQVLDDESHPDGRVPETSAGSIYGVVAPTGTRLQPAGEYNRARVIVRGARIEHHLNGQQVLEVDLDSEDFRDRVAASTFSTLPEYASRRDGHVALQHASVSPLRAPVWFRNVRIRELPELERQP